MRSLRLTLRAIAILSLVVSVIWLLVEPGYEPLVVILGGVAALLGTFAVKEASIRSVSSAPPALLGRRGTKSLWGVPLILFIAIVMVVTIAAATAVFVFLLSQWYTPGHTAEGWTEYSTDWITFEYPESWSSEDRSPMDAMPTDIVGIFYPSMDDPEVFCAFGEFLNQSEVPDWLFSSSLLLAVAQETLTEGSLGEVSEDPSDCAFSRSRSVRIDGIPATQTIVECQTVEGKEGEGWLGIVSPAHLDGYIFVYACMAMRGSWREHEPTVQQILDSMQLHRHQ